MLVRPVFTARTEGTLMRNFTRRQDTQHVLSHQLHDHIAISAAKDHHYSLLQHSHFELR
jgi:hypothetical protein